MSSTRVGLCTYHLQAAWPQSKPTATYYNND